MAFREVSVVQIREALRRWLKGEGERPIANGFGVDVWTMVAFMNHPGSPCPPEPGWMRKSFRMYWFSSKTPLRVGRSATQPCAPAITAATAAILNKARIGL